MGSLSIRIRRDCTSPTPERTASWCGTCSGRLRRTLYKFPDASVDGISFDEAGRLWVARLDDASLDVLSKAGQLLRSYPVTSFGKVTNMAWWGHSLFVTSSVENVIRRFDLDFGDAPAIPKAAAANRPF